MEVSWNRGTSKSSILIFTHYWVSPFMDMKKMREDWNAFRWVSAHFVQMIWDCLRWFWGSTDGQRMANHGQWSRHYLWGDLAGLGSRSIQMILSLILASLGSALSAPHDILKMVWCFSKPHFWTVASCLSILRLACRQMFHAQTIDSMVKLQDAVEKLWETQCMRNVLVGNKPRLSNSTRFSY